MTRHLIRLIWNRKRQNFLLTVEMFFSFLTLFGVVLIAAQLHQQLPPATRIRDRPRLEHERRPQGVGPGPRGQGAASPDL